MERWRIGIETEPVDEGGWNDQIEDLLDALSRERTVVGAIGWSTSGPALGSVFEVRAPSAREALEIGLTAFERALEAIGADDVKIHQVKIEPEWFEGDDVLGAVDAARLLGISRQRFYQLQEKPGFPSPAAELARGALWRRGDIEAFAASRSRTAAR